MKNDSTLKKWGLPLLFIGVLIVNYLSSAGILVPMTQAEVSDKYTNLLAPAGFTFSIWGVIYLGVILSLILIFLKRNNEEFQNNFQSEIAPLFVQWMVFNILWIFSWSYEWLLVSFIVIFLYAYTMLRVAGRIAKNPILSKHKWFLFYPAGLHFGWMISATFANLTALLVSWGFPGIGTGGIIWTIAALLVILGISTFYTYRYRNFAILTASLWTLLGIMIKHNPTSSFQHAELAVFIFSVFLFVVGVVISVNYFNNKKETKRKR